MIYLAVFTLYFFGNHFTAKIMASLYAYETITVEDIDEPYDLGIVLTGYTDMNPELTNFKYFHYFNHNANRLTQSLELYKLGKVKKLMVCGGSGHLLGDKTSEGTKTLYFLIKMGMSKEDILLEPNSRNTVENARFAAEHLKEIDPNGRYDQILLLTNNFHMLRSKKCFDKAGLKVVPFSLGDQPHDIDIDLEDFLPHPSAMEEWHKMIREWAGLLGYKLMGYI